MTHEEPFQARTLSARFGSRAVRSHRHSAEQIPPLEISPPKSVENSNEKFSEKSADRIPEKIRRTSRALPSEVATILEAGAPEAGVVRATMRL
jgi:hypothetical protein